MTQVSKQPRRPMSPKQALTRRRPVDGLLDADLFKALGDRTRLRLVACLVKCARACTVSEIAECCSVDFSVVSRHLQLLERSGVLESNRTGRTVSYRVRGDELAAIFTGLAEAMSACGGCCGTRDSSAQPGKACC
ncbi:MAG: winged helix-turn-helix transcriptional regulator [Phycisphaerales bacterium]|nr:winged helix-turn-helix transcriptional regulator [Phycisphaerales bacterium]